MFSLHYGDGEEGLDRQFAGIVAQALRGNNHIRKILGLFPGGADADEPASPGEFHGARGDGVVSATDPPERQYPVIAVVEEKGVSVGWDEARNDIEHLPEGALPLPRDADIGCLPSFPGQCLDVRSAGERIDGVGVGEQFFIAVPRPLRLAFDAVRDMGGEEGHAGEGGCEPGEYVPSLRISMTREEEVRGLDDKDEAGHRVGPVAVPKRGRRGHEKVERQKRRACAAASLNEKIKADGQEDDEREIQAGGAVFDKEGGVRKGEGEEEESGKPVYEETFRQARPEKQAQGGSDAVQTEACGDGSFHTFLLLFISSSKYFRYRTSHSLLPSGTFRESDWIVRRAAASASSSNWNSATKVRLISRSSRSSA